MLGIINCYIMEYTLGTDKMIILASWFYVLYVVNISIGVILLKEVPYDIIGIIGCITQKHTLVIKLGTYYTIGINIFYKNDDVILLKQGTSNI